MSSAAPTAALRGDPIYFRRAFPIGLSSSSCPAFYKAEGTRDETYDCQEACSSCKIVRATHSITGPSRLYKISSNVRCLLGAGLVDSFEYHAVILALDLAILTPNPRPAPNVHQYGEYHLRLGDAWMSRSPNRPTTPYHDPRYRYARIPSVSSTFQFRTDEPSDYIIAPLAVPEVASTVFMRPSPRATDRLEDRPGPVMFASRSLFTAFRWFCASGFRSGCWRSHLLARPSNSHNPDRGMKSKGVLMGSTDGRVFLCQYLSRTGDSIVEFCSRSGRKRITTTERFRQNVHYVHRVAFQMAGEVLLTMNAL
ncbi:hypothetical protein KC317_g3 [Hortaea werneckii]|nr:hypothetical protein KC317_g3 [Hortaea werneckii]